MRKKIFIRFFLLTLCAVLVVFASGLFAMHRNNEQIIEERLVLESDILLHLIKSEEDVTRLENYTNKEDFRITVIRENGEVLYESSIDGILEDNHADRDEIQYAINGTPTTVERYSETFGCNMTYYAVASQFDTGETFILRIAVHSSEITSYLGVMLPFLLFVLFVALALAGLIANKLSAHLSAKVKSVATGLRSLNEGHYTPIETDSSEAEFYAVFREINELAGTTHKQLRTLEEEQKKLKTVLDNISQGIIAVDSDKKIVFANPAVCSLFESNNHHVGDPLIFLVDNMELYERIGKSSSSDSDFEYKLEEKDIAVAVRHITAEERSSVSSIIIITDITKEKNIAREKSDFFANASHELKTPITVLLGLTELLLAKSDAEDTGHAQLERIHHESSRLAGLISDMLELSGLERNSRDVSTKTEVDLRTVCEEVLSELSPKLTAKQLTSTINGSGTVTADSGQIYELVENICSNAINYNKDNGTIIIELTETDDTVTLTVADSGIGIAQEHLPRLCERFYRVDKSRSKKTGGTGLGLAIVKHICMLNNATLNIESEFGMGTTVQVSFKKKSQDVKECFGH